MVRDVRNSLGNDTPNKPLLLALCVGLSAFACGGDGGGDASKTDAGPIDAIPNPEPNPHGIALTDVTFDLPMVLGGRLETNKFGVGSGAAVADVDGDGNLDVFLARCDGGVDEGGPSLLLRRTGGATDIQSFASDPVIEAAFADSCAYGAAFGDYDNDGDADLFVAMDGADRLYRNDGTGVLTDVTAASGVAGPDGDVNTSAYWADVNHDGLLDLFVPGHFPLDLPEPGPTPLNRNRLYINQADGTFASVGEAAGIEGDGSTQSAAITDLDGDGDLEIYVANDRFAIDGEAREEIPLDPDQWLDVTGYSDDGVPTYADRGAEFEVDGPRSSMGIAIADIDNDGNDDIFVSDFGTNHMQIWNPATSKYEDKALDFQVGLRDALLLGFLIAWDAAFADLDRDGHHELIVIHGSIAAPRACDSYTQFDYVMRYEPILSRFLDITADVGLPFDETCPPLDGRPVAGRGLILADLDGDHDDDLIVTPYVERYRFYENTTPQADRHVLRIQPVGTVSAPTPYGAILEVTRADSSTLRRNLYAGGTNTQRFPRLEAGLGDETTLQSATLHWPSGYSQRLDMSSEFAIDTTWTISEPEWLTLSRRVSTQAQGDVELIYTPMDEAGNPIGAPAAGRTIQVLRSDGGTVNLTPNANGTYTALLPHPGTPGITVVRVVDEDVTLRPRLTINYK